MRILLLVTSVVFAFGCQTAVPPPTGGADGTTGPDGIALSLSTPERLTGTYVDPTGIGINFDSARVGDTLYLDLTTRAGVKLVHAETVGETYVFSYMGRLTLTIDKSWVAAVQAEEPDGPAAQDTTAMHWAGDMTVLDEMLAIPEVKLMPWMSRALGAEGFTGSAFPASLALHKMARQSADALDIQVPSLDVADADGENAACSRPTANECYGMCGNGCNCWSWVCGDCCYHSGCAKHDTWCRQGQWYYCYNITAVIALFGC
jgi:hypothetical protein